MTNRSSHDESRIYLDPMRIEIWSVGLTADQAVYGRLWALLSDDEQRRAQRFAIEDVRRRYVISRGVLRRLLSRYVGRPARDLVFAYSSKGKPYLRGAAPLPHFNVTHSRDLASYAFAADCALGVDVEKVRSLRDFSRIAARFFCPAEAAEIQSLDPHEQRAAFFRCWTRKEAYVKALGEGLSVALNSFQVTLLPESSARFVHIGAVPAYKWMLHHLEPAPGYTGALAYQGEPRLIATRSYRSPGELLARCESRHQDNGC